MSWKSYGRIHAADIKVLPGSRDDWPEDRVLRRLGESPDDASLSLWILRDAWEQHLPGSRVIKGRRIHVED